MIRNWYTYNAVFTPSEEGYIITFPDFPGLTARSSSKEEGIKISKKILGNHIYSLEEKRLPVPAPAANKNIKLAAGAFIEQIELMMPLIRNEIANAPAPAEVTLPEWLLALAEQKKISLSETLKDALLEECLGIKPLPRRENFAATLEQLQKLAEQR